MSSSAGSQSDPRERFVSPASTIPSSPPPASVSDAEYDPKQDAMQQEEEKLRKQSEREAKRRRELHERNGQKNGQDEQSLKDLDWFLSRSQVRSSIPSQL